MDSLSRRKILIDQMSSLEKEGLNCRGCAGTCCTFEANSMMVTPLETVELLIHLKANSRLTSDLKDKCLKTIKDFRLDQVLNTGKRSVLRRTYTCPFFEGSELGCSLSRSIKPYGCLAFNSHQPVKAGPGCYSDQNLLKDREELFEFENEVNARLQKWFNLSWEKTSLPIALMELWEKDFSAVDLSIS